MIPTTIIVLVLSSAIGATYADDYSTDAGDSSSYSIPFGTVTVIEDQPDGIYVATSDVNYAIVTPKLKENGWLTVSVNGDQVYIFTTENKAMAVSMAHLSEHSRDFLTDVRSNFIRNLAGLELRSEYQSTFSAFESAGAAAAVAASSPAANGFAGAYGNLAAELSTGSGAYAARQAASSSRRLAKSAARGLGDNRAPQQAKSAQYVDPYSNYYNLDYSPLNQSLAGDVYQLDSNSNILEVYSSSVSIKRKSGLAIVYRDHRYFVYSQRHLPQSINTFTLFGEFVFFVYQDGTIIVKAGHKLGSVELDLVVSARAQLKSVAAWQAKAAAINGKPSLKEYV